jgi:D-glycero-D-manno-heptose 1,7-bisphosphate phosphatase
VEAGRRAGCRSVLLDVGHETEWVRSPLRTPHHVARDLLEAARLIVADDQPVGEHAAPSPGIEVHPA